MYSRRFGDLLQFGGAASNLGSGHLNQCASTCRFEMAQFRHRRWNGIKTEVGVFICIGFRDSPEQVFMAGSHAEFRWGNITEDSTNFHFSPFVESYSVLSVVEAQLIDEMPFDYAQGEWFIKPLPIFAGNPASQAHLFLAAFCRLKLPAQPQRPRPVPSTCTVPYCGQRRGRRGQPRDSDQPPAVRPRFAAADNDMECDRSRHRADIPSVYPP